MDFVKSYFGKNEPLTSVFSKISKNGGSVLIWKKTKDKSVQLVRGSFLSKHFLLNPYFNTSDQDLLTMTLVFFYEKSMTSKFDAFSKFLLKFQRQHFDLQVDHRAIVFFSSSFFTLGSFICRCTHIAFRVDLLKANSRPIFFYDLKMP